MNCYDMVIKYVDFVGKGVPFFIDEVQEFIIENNSNVNQTTLYNNIKATLSRLNKEGVLETAYSGIYYVPTINVFGKMAVGNADIINFKYITDKKGNIKGYVTGAKLFNEAHLTTQVPNVIDIASNECTTYNKYKNEHLNVIVRKPKMRIDNDNYKYLQLFDLIENKDNIKIEADNVDDILYRFIKDNQLDFEKIIKYAMITKSRGVINKVLMLAR